jgi:hypothetical protein
MSKLFTKRGERLKTAEDLADTWPVEGSFHCIRWRRMLQRWREMEPPLLLRHIHYEVLYKDSHSVYAYDEGRVLHLVWHTYEKGFHPLCTQLMLTHGKSIKEWVTNSITARNGSVDKESESE